MNREDEREGQCESVIEREKTRLIERGGGD